MTSIEKEHILNTYYAEILQLKIYLSDTDYQTVREFEGGEPMPAEIREKRANARTRINELEALITETEAIEVDDPSIEELIETLGGSIDLSPKTTHILVSKPIRKKDFESLKKKSNSNIKLIKDDWFLEFLCSFTLPDESKFSVDIID